MKFLSLLFNLFISLASISFGQNSDSLLASADQLFNERKFEESIGIYNTLIKSDSSNAIYFLNRGKAFAQIREYNPALKDLNYSISLVNNNSDSYRTRANIHGRLGNYQLKSIDLQKANKLEEERKQVDTGIIDSLGIKISSSSFNTEYILEIPNTSQSILFVNAGEWMAKKYRSVCPEQESNLHYLAITRF
jgi:tetratricopeptide (TPR) repeat protein